MEFKLTIEIGNAGMLSGADLADALIEVASKVNSVSEGVDQVAPTGNIRDRNGNKVGEWVVTK